MKTLMTLAIAFLLCQIGATVVVAQNQNDTHHRHVAAAAKVAEKPVTPSSATLSAFEKLKSLVGEWEARDRRL